MLEGRKSFWVQWENSVCIRFPFAAIPFHFLPGAWSPTDICFHMYWDFSLFFCQLNFCFTSWFWAMSLSTYQNWIPRFKKKHITQRNLFDTELVRPYPRCYRWDLDSMSPFSNNTATIIPTKVAMTHGQTSPGF